MPRFPRTGPARDGSPPSVGTIKALRLPARHPFGLLIRQPVPRVTCCGVGVRLRAPVSPQAGGRARGLLVRRTLVTVLPHVDRTGPPRFPDEPSRGYAHVLGPRPVPQRLAVDGAGGAAPSAWKLKAPTLRISRLNSAASPPVVYASSRSLPNGLQHSLPAGGLHLCRTGVEPAGSPREVSAHRHSPLQDLSWRNHASVQVAQEWLRRADQAGQRGCEPEVETVRPVAPGGAWPGPTGGLPALRRGGICYLPQRWLAPPAALGREGPKVVAAIPLSGTSPT